MPVMTEQEARGCVERAKDHFIAAGRHIAEARKEIARLEAGQGWQALGYESLSKCVKAELGYSRQHVHRLLQSIEIEQNLDVTLGDEVEITERLLRPLAAYKDKNIRQLLFDFARTWADNNSVKLTGGIVEATCDALGEELTTGTFIGGLDHAQLSLYDKLDAHVSANVLETTLRHKSHIQHNQRQPIIRGAPVNGLQCGPDYYCFFVPGHDDETIAAMQQAAGEGALYLSVYLADKERSQF